MAWVDGYISWTTRGPAWRLVAGVALAVFVVSTGLTAYVTSDRAGVLPSIEQLIEDDLPIESNAVEAIEVPTAATARSSDLPALLVAVTAITGVYLLFFAYETWVLGGHQRS